MPKRRKRRRKPIRVPVISLLWGPLAVNVVAAAYYSPITAITKVRVTGAPPYDQERIRNFLKLLANRPFIRVSPRRVETQMLQSPAIAGASLSINPFGRGVLKITPRTPVARLGEAGTMVLGSDGVPFRQSAPSPALPTLLLPKEAQGPNLSFFSPWEPRLIAQACQKFLPILPKGNWKIEVDQRGAICFNRTGSGRIVLGDSSALDEKLRTLQQILAKNPQMLDGVEELNLTAPDSPAMVPSRTRQ